MLCFGLRIFMRKTHKTVNNFRNFPAFDIETAEAAGIKAKFPLADDVKINELVALDSGTIPVEDFFQNPEKTSFSISPNGQYLAYLRPYENRLNLFVRNVNGAEATRITSRTDRDIPGYF